MSSKAAAAAPAPVEKAYPNVKTIILRENDSAAVKDPDRVGVWSRALDQDLVLNDGDSVVLKSSFVDTTASSSGLIKISDEDIEQLSITTGCYWQDSGCGVPIEAYPKALHKTGGPPPLMSQVMLSEGAGTTPNGRNYILNNTTDDFTNTKLYLNTGTADQTVNIPAPGTGYPAATVSLVEGGTGYTAASGVATIAAAGTGTGCTVNIEVNADTYITSAVIDANGMGYAVGNILTIQQTGHTGTPATIQVTSPLLPGIPITVEMVPNPNYDPMSATHEFYDYEWNGFTPVTPEYTYLQPTPQTGTGNIYLTDVRNISQLKIRSSPATNNLFFIYPFNYSQGHDWSVKPSDNAHMAIMVSNLDANNIPEWRISRNTTWEETSDGITSPLEQGWLFLPKAPNQFITFGTGDQPGVFRICTGMWLWVWQPYPSDAFGSTYPAYTQKNPPRGINYYSMNLEYYMPGNSQGGSFGPNKSTLQKIPKEWEPPVKDNTEQRDFYNPQFKPYADTARAGLNTYQVPNAPLPPVSQFPQSPNPPQRKINAKSVSYPIDSNAGTFVPCWFSNMQDTTSTSAAIKQISAFPEFIYDSNPGLSLGATEPDSLNFAPFRVTSGGVTWQFAKKDMEGYQQAGFLQQDARGCIKTGPNGTYIPQGIPPIWENHSAAMNKTTWSLGGTPPPFKLTHDCVVSKPYIPGIAKHMTARTFKTMLKDIPGNNLESGTYTYAAWARILTDTLNRVEQRITGLSNQPSIPVGTGEGFFPLNEPTYSSSRIFTDTVQLGYQGLNFPDSRRGLGWDFTAAGAQPPHPVATYDETGKLVSYVNSEQPYWSSENGGDIFRYKDGIPAGTDPVDLATVDPTLPDFTATPPLFQDPTVFGQNGPKWIGAESLSIVYNDVASAFEIVQMHSNMYSATSGAVITRQSRSGAKNVVYVNGIQELNISDQEGGVFINDWQPSDLWETRMNLSKNILVHVGGVLPKTNMQRNSFLNDPSVSSVANNPVTLSRGLNITGNFRSATGLVDKRTNIQSNTPTPPASDFIGGNYQSPVVDFNLETETNTPVTILGKTITPGELKDPFFMIELTGINRNEIFGLDQENCLISSIVGRYFSTASYTQGSDAGSIQYVHRGEPMLIRELGIRILDSTGAELSTSVISPESAVVIQINGQDITIEPAAPIAPTPSK